MKSKIYAILVITLFVSIISSIEKANAFIKRQMWTCTYTEKDPNQPDIVREYTFFDFSCPPPSDPRVQTEHIYQGYQYISGGTYYQLYRGETSSNAECNITVHGETTGLK